MACNELDPRYRAAMAKAKAKTKTAKKPAARKPAAKKPAAKKPAKPAAHRRGWVPPPSLPGAAAALTKVRAVCLALPEVVERPSHGAPTFFIGAKGKSFLNFSDNHHADGRLAVVVAAPPGFQAMILDTNRDAYYRPPYVGGAGWVGVRLDRGTSWDEIATVIEQAYLTVAPPSLAAKLRGD
jgi:hypothetical protein